MSLDVSLSAVVTERREVFDGNITHNLNRMADSVGLYQPLWRPEELGATKAGQLIEPLRVGVAKLEAEREACEKLNPSNGWGDYEGLLSFARRYLAACEEYPDADIQVSR